jgi:hypothetical protein
LLSVLPSEFAQCHLGLYSALKCHQYDWITSFSQAIAVGMGREQERGSQTPGAQCGSGLWGTLGGSGQSFSFLWAPPMAGPLSPSCHRTFVSAAPANWNASFFLEVVPILTCTSQATSSRELSMITVLQHPPSASTRGIWTPRPE